MYTLEDLRDILDYMLSSNIDLSNPTIKDLINHIRRILFENAENDFELDYSIKQMLVEDFLKGDHTITEYTPFFIKGNLDCIRESIKRDISSIDYINNFPEDIASQIVPMILASDYVLTTKSPSFVRRNFDLIAILIENNCKNIDGVDWEYFYKTPNYSKLINLVINSEYVLSEDSPLFLKKNYRVAMSSIKKDINSGAYIDEEQKKKESIFGYLLLHGYNFSEFELKNTSLSLFRKPEVMKKALSELGVLDLKGLKLSEEDTNKYIDRYVRLFTSSLNEKLTIKSFKELSDYSSEEYWKKHKYENANLYKNVFGKISAELQRNCTYEEALLYLGTLLSNMKLVLEDRYSLLEDYLKKTYDVYHNPNSVYDKDTLRNDLSKLCALYVAKCKGTFKKNVVEECNLGVKPWYTIRKDSKYIQGRQLLKLQREELKNNIKTDPGLKKCIKRLCHIKSIRNEVKYMINGFIINGCNHIEQLYKMPEDYGAYKRLKETIQLIRRLNLGNIKYDSIEVSTYKDIIKYDNISNMFYYDGPLFDMYYLINILEGYETLERAFNYIKYEIIKYAKTINIPEKVIEEYLEKNLDLDEIPFTDEFYEFSDELVKHCSLGDFIEKCISIKGIKNVKNLLDDDRYNDLKDFVVNSGSVWFLLMNTENVFDKKKFNLLLEHLEDVIDLSKSLGYKLDNFGDYVDGASIVSYADKETLAILGRKNVLTLSTGLAYTDGDPERILEISKELLCKKAIRNEFTVPFVSGETNNYKYSLYDTLDDSYLLTGIYTHSCFTPDGTDNDFFHYCALDKNGFVIKITDKQGFLVARAAGFREGNTVYLNQLRTVYDLGNNDYNNNSNSETLQIVETLKTACRDILLTSLKTSEEEDKIENIFITRSYAMSLVPSNVPDHIKRTINAGFIKRKSEDWENFRFNTKNLKESISKNIFKTDYDNTFDLICLASKEGTSCIDSKNIVFKDVKPVYKRVRNNIESTTVVTREVIDKINKIKAIGSYLTRMPYEKVFVPENSVIFIGDNWYMIYTGYEFNTYFIPGDKDAEMELNETKKIFTEYLTSNPDKSESSIISKEMGTKVYSFNNKKDNE